MQLWLIFGVFVIIVFLGVRVFFLERTLRKFVGKTPESMLMEHARTVELLERESKQLRGALEHLAANSVYSIQKVGVVRFNPFSDSGGDQSFVIALLDGQNNGVVVSSLFAQGRPMVYAKPIEDGKSRYQLSGEEKDALARATNRA